MVKIEKWRIKTAIYPLNKNFSFLIIVMSDPYLTPTIQTIGYIPYGIESFLYLKHVHYTLYLGNMHNKNNLRENNTGICLIWLYNFVN